MSESAFFILLFALEDVKRLDTPFFVLRVLLGQAFVPIAVTIAIAVTVAISVTIAISVSIMASIERLFVVFHIVKDGTHVREGFLFVQAFYVEEHTLIKLTGTNHEAGMVCNMFDDVGVDNHAGRCTVDDDVVITLAQFTEHLVEFGTAQQFGGVRWNRTGEERIDTRCNYIVLDKCIEIVFFIGKIVHKTRLVTAVEFAGE